MKKSAKISLMILCPVIVLLWLFVTILKAFVVVEEEPLRYPSGGLSESIFDSQNMTYTSSQNFSSVYSYKKIPYDIGCVSADSASIGNGVVYPVSDGVYLYFSVIPDEDININIHEFCMNEFSKALLYNYSVENSSYQNASYDKGFLNGFSVIYNLDILKITDNETALDAALFTYVCDVENYGYDMVVGVATTYADSNDYLSASKVFLDELMYTIQINNKTKEVLDKSLGLTSRMHDNIKRQWIVSDECEEMYLVSADDSDVVLALMSQEKKRAKAGQVNPKTTDVERTASNGVLKNDGGDLTGEVDEEEAGGLASTVKFDAIPSKIAIDISELIDKNDILSDVLGGKANWEMITGAGKLVAADINEVNGLEEAEVGVFSSDGEDLLSEDVLPVGESEDITFVFYYDDGVKKCIRSDADGENEVEIPSK